MMFTMILYRRLFFLRLLYSGVALCITSSRFFMIEHAGINDRDRIEY